MELKVGSVANYPGRPPTYSLPVEIGHFSVNSDGKYRDDDHQMKYLAMPEKLTDLHLNLNEGYSDYIHIVEDAAASFEAILRWILSHEEQIRIRFADNRSSDGPKIDFVCYRGLLTAVSSTIYENSEDWLLVATKFRSVIYMEVVKTQGKLDTEEDMGEKGKLMSTWGFKFEQYMTSDTMNSRPNTSVPVNENEKYFSVMKGKLDNHSILFACEMDAVNPEHFKQTGHDPKSVLRYIELKTSRLITAERQNRNFLRFKLLKWYLQSYFAGVPRVICGFRDDDGIVRKLHNFNVRDMPKMAEGHWSSPPCMIFCSRLLNFIKNCGMKDDPRVVYEIYWKPGSNITCKELTSEYQLLPDWYIEKVKVI